MMRVKGSFKKIQMAKYIQTKDVSWLETPKGTIWVDTGMDEYIQPEDHSLRTTAFGVDLSLLDEIDLALFDILK
jgi:hypothetical protein